MDIAALMTFLIMLVSINNMSVNKVPEDDGWNVTVYYTPVEQFHGGESTTITNENGTIGSYPSDFLEIVKVEGVGKITSGEHAGSYLHWTPSLGYWLTEEPLDAQGNMLIPFKTAASYSNVESGTHINITDCGRQTATSTKLPQEICETIKSADWVVTDRFHTEMDEKHIDLYIGEEDRVDFTTSPFYFALEDVNIILY